MRIQEERHAGESWLQWKVGNLLSVDQDIVKSVGVAWGFREAGAWIWAPRLTGDASLFYNAVLFARLILLWGVIPAGFFWSVRWSPATDRKALLQSGIGIKVNGRFAILLRVQSDTTSAAGVTGPNVGQATGFDFGTH